MLKVYQTFTISLSRKLRGGFTGVLGSLKSAIKRTVKSPDFRTEEKSLGLIKGHILICHQCKEKIEEKKIEYNYLLVIWKIIQFIVIGGLLYSLKEIKSNLSYVLFLLLLFTIIFILPRLSEKARIEYERFYNFLKYPTSRKSKINFAKKYLRQCPSCGNWVCKNCWILKGGKCVDCA